MEKNFPNYGIFNKKKVIKNSDDFPFEVDFVDGFSPFLAWKRMPPKVETD